MESCNVAPGYGGWSKSRAQVGRRSVCFAEILQSFYSICSNLIMLQQNLMEHWGNFDQEHG